MAEKQNTPEIRFEGFTDPWEQRKFSDLVLIERGGSPRPIDAYITEDPAGLNWVKIGDAPSMGRYITTTSEKSKPEGLSKTRQVYPGDLVLSNSMSFGRPYIMAVEGCIHDGWLLIRDTQNQFDPVFLCHMLGTPQMLDQYRMFASGSTVNNLNKELVGNAMVPLPDRDEQVKIGNYLDELDGLITLHQRECGKPPFNQSPAWEQRKFSDMYVVNNERNVNCELGYDRTLSIATMTFNGGNGAADDSLSNYKVIRVGDIAFEGHTNKVHAYGRFVLNDAGDGLMSPRFSCLRPIVEQRYSFWKYYIPREESMRPILVNATKNGTMMNELVPDDLMHESILVPCLAEQEVIGNSFSQLDHVITLHQRMCPIFSFCAHGSRTNFAQTLQGWLQILRYPRPIPKMLVSPSAPASGVFGTAKGAFICASSSAGASTSSPSARKNFITSSTLCCRESLSSP